MANGKLYEKLIEYSKNGKYPLHMPGHKRTTKLLNGVDPFEIDITEIEGFDDLHEPTGIIKQAMDEAATFWQTDKTWFVVNGSTCGILSAIHAVTEIGDHIIAGSNCHSSVMNAAKIRNLKVTEIEPTPIKEFGIDGGYNTEKLKELLSNNKDVKAVVLTSPTYEGIISDIEKLAEITHNHDAVLIVDEAHGAHLGISKQWPKPAYKCGADIVIESAHKTLPALTQSSFLHMMNGRVDEAKLKEALDLYETTSPSYVLLASMDYAMKMVEEEGLSRAERLLITLDQIRSDVNEQGEFVVPTSAIEGKNDVYRLEPSKLLIKSKNGSISGEALAAKLRNEYNYEVEKVGKDYVLCMTSLNDDISQLEKIVDAINKINEKN